MEVGNLVEGTRNIEARTSRVWELLVDVEGWPDTFTPHLKEAHLDGALQPGATGWIRTGLPMPRSSFTVSAVDDGRSWAWQGRLLWLTMDYDHRCEPTDTGSKVTFEVSLNGPLAALVRPLASLIYRPQMNRALDLLVANAEGTPLLRT